VIEAIDTVMTVGFMVAGFLALIWVWSQVRALKKDDEEHEFHKGPDD